MSKSGYKSKYVVCPYYRHHDGNCIHCEGIDKTNSIHVVFGDKAKMKEFCDRHCNSFKGYPKCLVCKALNKKYGVDEDED